MSIMVLEHRFYILRCQYEAALATLNILAAECGLDAVDCILIPALPPGLTDRSPKFKAAGIDRDIRKAIMPRRVRAAAVRVGEILELLVDVQVDLIRKLHGEGVGVPEISKHLHLHKKCVLEAL
jgi:hypothetical protein